jgi:hypothetical protein
LHAKLHPVAALLERFPAKWKPVRAKKTRQIKIQRRAQGNASGLADRI